MQKLQKYRHLKRTSLLLTVLLLALTGCATQYVPAKTELKLTSPPAYSTPVPSASYSTQVQNWLEESQKKLMDTSPTK